jgi:hypothetical protein
MIQTLTQREIKISNYKDLEIDVSRMWNVGEKIVPVVNWSIRKS